jgi:hypothetical protein
MVVPRKLFFFFLKKKKKKMAYLEKQGLCFAAFFILFFHATLEISINLIIGFFLDRGKQAPNGLLSFFIVTHTIHVLWPLLLLSNRLLFITLIPQLDGERCKKSNVIGMRAE